LVATVEDFRKPTRGERRPAGEIADISYATLYLKRVVVHPEVVHLLRFVGISAGAHASSH
jgi:hypothetical protein